MMKIVHTADWHLGKIVNNFSMLEDQAYYFDKMIDKLRDIKPDILVMAGDLYDRTNPPKEAITLANHIFTSLINDLNIKVLVISGNHDSPEKVEYGSGLMEKSGLYIEGVAKTETKEVIIDDVHFWLVPFVDPVTGRETLGNSEIKTYENLAREQVRRIEERMEPETINIMIYHGFIISGSSDSVEESDSERPLTIGTTEYVPVEIFKAFDYVMLGHLHKGQKVKKDTIRYSGSPLKYSKSEANHHKGFDLIEIEGGEINREKLELLPKRDMRVIKGHFKDLMKDTSKDYVFAELTDEYTIMDAMNRLRQNYPNIMEMQYVNLHTRADSKENTHTSQSIKKRSTVALFEDFYTHYTERELNDKQQEYLIEAVKTVQKEDEK